ncbi:MAG: class I SAM-dependent methyltransferase [Candidatus Kerfeldbacteria bacterium]
MADDTLPVPQGKQTTKEQKDSYSEYATFWAERMRAGGSFSHTHIEKPVMFGRMKELAQGKAVLCIGCGSGEECDVINTMGPERVVGTDISEGLIEEAKKAFPGIEFHVMAAEDHSALPEESFDIIFSSLTMHYVKNWEHVFKGYYRLLKPGGVFLFSANHPIRRGMELVRRPGSRVSSLLLGYSAEPDNQQVKIYGDYLNFFTQHDRFMKKIQVTYYNRPFSQMWHEIKNAGFEIADIMEPKSVQENVPDNFSGFSKITQKIPYFIMFECKKPGA